MFGHWRGGDELRPGAEELLRRERQLVALLRRRVAERPLEIQPGPRAPRAGELLVDEVRDARLERARPEVVRRDPKVVEAYFGR